MVHRNLFGQGEDEMSEDWISIGGGAITAAINPYGAELSSLRDADGRELMTNADPAFWTGHAPLLFPIVGALNGGTYRLDGKSYAMGQHGVARRQPFTLVEQTTDHVMFRLTDTDVTREAYPFAFALDADYRLDGTTLTITITAHNRGERDMPASFGFHPAFAWPLPYGQDRAAHRILFDADEPDALCVLDGGLIASEDLPTPVDGQMLALRDDLFTQDALIWRTARSRSCRYGAPEGPQLRIEWSDMPSLGIWTKPGAHYVCVEPWDGIADPVGFTGEIWDKPGIRRIAPGASVSWWMSVTLQAE
jgi:galactose mutarotase-like enzyme